MECGPITPLTSLKKQFDSDVLKDSFRGSSQLLKEPPPSAEILHQQQFAEAFFQNDSISSLNHSTLPSDMAHPNEPNFVFHELKDALEPSSDSILNQKAFSSSSFPYNSLTSTPMHSNWQSEFQSFQPLLSNINVHEDPTALHHFENVFQQAHSQVMSANLATRINPVQDTASSWIESFNTFNHTPAITLTEEESNAMDQAFQQLHPLPALESNSNDSLTFDEDRFQAEQWTKEFISSTTTSSNSYELAQAAGEVLEALDQQKDFNFSNSEFVKFMQQLKDEDLVIDGQSLINETSWADQFQNAIEQWESSVSEFGGVPAQGIEKDWAESFDLNTTGWEDQGLEEIPYTWDAALPHYQTYHFEPNNPFLTLPKEALELKSMENLPLSESILVLEAKLTHASNDSTLWYQLGAKQQENEKEHQAIAALRQSLKLDPSQLDAWLALAVSYTNENRSECACDALKCWLQHHPQYNSVLPNSFSSSMSVPPMPYVLAEAFLKAVSLSTHVDPDLQVGLGVLFNLTDEYDRAIDCFHVALACRPYDAFLWNKLGATLANSNQSEKAMDAYFRALQINPHYIRARYNLGIACIHLKQYNEAIHQFIHALVSQHQLNTPTESTTTTTLPSSSSFSMPETATANNNITTATTGSTHIWESLKMACLLSQHSDLASLCDQRDLKTLKEKFQRHVF